LRALHLSIFEQSQNSGLFNKPAVYIISGCDKQSAL
jgi:hypothetical protein